LKDTFTICADQPLRSEWESPSRNAAGALNDRSAFWEVLLITVKFLLGMWCGYMYQNLRDDLSDFWYGILSSERKPRIEYNRFKRKSGFRRDDRRTKISDRPEMVGSSRANGLFTVNRHFPIVSCSFIWVERLTLGRTAQFKILVLWTNWTISESRYRAIELVQR
jgi:hypothetical protein